MKVWTLLSPDSVGKCLFAFNDFKIKTKRQRRMNA